MSYYTQYNIQLSEIVNNDFNHPVVINTPPNRLLHKLQSLLPSEIEQITDTEYEGMATWYNHEADLAPLSKEYPNVLFTIHGDGEESDDIWVTYIHNGLVQNHSLVRKDPPIDISKWTFPQPTLDQIKSSLKTYKPNSPEYDKLKVLATILSIQTGIYFLVTDVPNQWDSKQTYTTVATLKTDSHFEPKFIISVNDHHNLLNMSTPDTFMTILSQIVNNVRGLKID